MSNTPRTDAIEAALREAENAGLVLGLTQDRRAIAGMILGALADGPYPEAPVIVWTRKPEGPPPDEEDEPYLVYACRTCPAEYESAVHLNVHTSMDHHRRISPEERNMIPQRIPRPTKKDTAP